jgi:hypothetical protein
MASAKAPADPKRGAANGEKEERGEDKEAGRIPWLGEACDA